MKIKINNEIKVSNKIEVIADSSSIVIKEINGELFIYHGISVYKLDRGELERLR